MNHDNPFSGDRLPATFDFSGAANSRGTHLGLDPGTMQQAAEWIGLAVASGTLGNAFFEFLKTIKQRFGRHRVEEYKEEVYRAMVRLKRKPNVSNEDIRRRVEEIFSENQTRGGAGS